MNPLQGMTSMLMAINPYFNPAVWIFQTGVPQISKEVVSFIVYFIEVTLSSFALGVALGFSRRFAFAACLWLAVLLFPPLNFVFGLQGWLATNPSYGHTLALSNLLLVAFIEIGAERRAKTSFAHRLAVNFLLANCILLLIMLSMLAAPFYNAGMLLGSLLLVGVIFLSSTSYQQILWRLGAGIYVPACCAALHFPEFFAGARDYSARFSAFDRAWLEFHWPARLSPELLAHARHGLCEWGVLCDRFTQWPLVATRSYWLQLSIILGGVAVAIRMPSPLARIGAVFSALWTVLLVVWIGASFGVIASPALSPLYVYLMMYPLWALLSLYVLTTLLEIGAAGLAPRIRSAAHAWAPPAICLIALVRVALFRASPADLFRTRGPQPRTSPIIEVLEREISLHPGQVFRGSVATLLGAAASPLRQQLLGNAERPLEPGAFEKFLQRRSSDTGSTHDLLDLWWRDIPTLSEYGQGLSKPLMFYVANVFNSPQDAQDLNFALPRLANIDVLRAMGVRFAITDLKLPSGRASVTRTVALKDGIELFLYELAHPNIAGFSPLKLSTHTSPSELLHRIRENPALFESEAFADSATTTKQLVPVQRSQIVFERGAVHVSATSAGASALLLPLQFSHCFRLVGEQSDRVRVLRANLIHTLVLFAGELDIRLKWDFSFWRNSGCRLRDAEDARALGLR